MRRGLLIACLLMGLLLPKMGTALASALPNLMVYVICTSEGLEVITIDEEGNPVATPVALVDTCLGDAPQPAQAQATAWQRLALDYHDPFRATPGTHPAPQLRLPPAQGPPAA